MTNSNVLTLERKVIDPKTVKSRVKIDGTIINVTSIFGGNKSYFDVLYEIGRSKISNNNPKIREF